MSEAEPIDRNAWLDQWLATEPAGTLPNVVRQLRAELAAATQTPPYHIPGPYEIALAVGAALAASGNYGTPGAALQAAWMAVPEFYQGRDTYLRELVPVIYGMSPQEGAADGAESRSFS